MNVSPRSVQILQAVFDMEEFLRREKIKKMENSSPAGDKDGQELPEQEHPGQELCEKTDSEKAEGEQMVPGQAEGEQTVPGQAEGEQMVPGQTSPGQEDCGPGPQKQFSPEE